MRYWLAVSAAVVTGAAAHAGAQDTSAISALDWLKKIADSSRTVSYSGTFAYQHGNRVDQNGNNYGRKVPIHGRDSRDAEANSPVGRNSKIIRSRPKLITMLKLDDR